MAGRVRIWHGVVRELRPAIVHLSLLELINGVVANNTQPLIFACQCLYGHLEE